MTHHGHLFFANQHIREWWRMPFLKLKFSILGMTYSAIYVKNEKSMVIHLYLRFQVFVLNSYYFHCVRTMFLKVRHNALLNNPKQIISLNWGNINIIVFQKRCWLEKQKIKKKRSDNKSHTLIPLLISINTFRKLMHLIAAVPLSVRSTVSNLMRHRSFAWFSAGSNTSPHSPLKRKVDIPTQQTRVPTGNYNINEVMYHITRENENS